MRYFLSLAGGLALALALIGPVSAQPSGRMRAPAVDQSNTFTGTNTFSGTTNFDGAVDMDSTLDLSGSTVTMPATQTITTLTTTTHNGTDETLSGTFTSNGTNVLGNAATDTTTVTGDLILSAAEVGIACRNETGGGLAAGDLVYQTSWDSTDVPLIAMADADAGVMAEYVVGATLANNTTGVCYSRIELQVGNTDAAAAEGDEVCVTPTATTTNTWAVEASCTAVFDEFQQIVGVVTVKSATVGKIFFDLPGRLKKIGQQELQLESVSVNEMADLARGSILTGQTAGNRPAALDANDSGKILVGDGTDLASVAVSGDATLAANGALAVVNTSSAIETIRGSDLNIADTNTISLDFTDGQEPDYIVVEWSSACVHDTTSQPGHTTGQVIVTITGTDTATSSGNASALKLNNATWEIESVQNDTTNIFTAKCGHDGTDQGTITCARTSWTTATGVLVTTCTVANTTDATNFIEYTATGYR